MSEVVEPPKDTCRFFRVFYKTKQIKDHFIGFTTWLLECKFDHMRKAYNNENDKIYNNKMNTFIRALGGWGNWDIELLEECEWQSRAHAIQRVMELVKASPNATLNQEFSTKTKEEQLQERRERDRVYKHNNKYMISERKTKKEVCDVCGSVYSHGNKSKHVITHKHQQALHNCIHDVSRV